MPDQDQMQTLSDRISNLLSTGGLDHKEAALLLLRLAEKHLVSLDTTRAASLPPITASIAAPEPPAAASTPAKPSEKIAGWSLVIGAAIAAVLIFLAGIFFWPAFIIGLLVAGTVYAEWLKLSAHSTIIDNSKIRDQ